MLAVELIQKGARNYPKNTAVRFAGEGRTFEQVYDTSRRIGNALLRLGLKKGDRVAFLLANSLHSVEIDFALLLAGLVRVPLNTRLSEAEHLYMIEETDARALLYTEEFAHRARFLHSQLKTVQYFCQMSGESNDAWAITMSDLIQSATNDEPPVILDENDLSTIQYTSGTTGKLKAAVHTQGTWAAICNNILSSLDVYENDIMLHAAPLTHASGLLVLPHWVRGAANSVLPGFQIEEYLQTIHHDKPTTINLVPTMIVMLLAAEKIEQYSFDSVRNIIYGASPMPREALKRGIELWGPKFIQYYGQTEAPLILTLLGKTDHLNDDGQTEKRLLSCGQPVPTTSLKIVDGAGDEVATGEIGEISVKTNQSMIGYWKAPELTREMINDGWLYTRDMGYVDEQGYLFLVDRKSDMIITGGFNVYPREVEEVLYQHPAVMEAAVIGVPDDKWVETIKAFVVLRSGHSATETELIEFCKSRLASYKKPSSVEFLDTLPKSTVGKVVRRVLRENTRKKP